MRPAVIIYSPNQTCGDRFGEECDSSATRSRLWQTGVVSDAATQLRGSQCSHSTFHSNGGQEPVAKQRVGGRMPKVIYAVRIQVPAAERCSNAGGAVLVRLLGGAWRYWRKGGCLLASDRDLKSGACCCVLGGFARQSFKDA